MGKLIAYPFDRKGNMLDYAFQNLTKEETELVYVGKKNSFAPYYKSPVYIWKPNGEFELTLNYENYSRGRSSVTFYFRDEYGHRYPMFMTDFDDLLKENIGVHNIRAIFTYVKRGQNYGLKFVRKCD